MNTKLTLSQAIRQGSQLHPKGTGNYVSIDPDNYPPTKLFTCALGAAFTALHPKGPAIIQRYLTEDAAEGTDVNGLIGIYLEAHIDDLNHIIKLPADVTYWNGGQRQTETYLKDVITLLNDDMIWTRTQIADWLEKEHGL